MAIYMQINGIDGDVTAKGHEKWIQISSLGFNIKRALSAEPGRLADREGTRPTISEVTLAKKMDKSSPLIFSEACVGKAKPEVKIDICQSGSSITPYMQYTLSNVIVSGYNVDSSFHPDNDEVKQYPKEQVTLSFDRIEMKYVPFDEKNSPQSPIPSGYDLKEAVAI